MTFVYVALAVIALLFTRALLRAPGKPRLVMNYREVNNPAVLRAAALTNTSHRNHEPTEF